LGGALRLRLLVGIGFGVLDTSASLSVEVVVELREKIERFLVCFGFLSWLMYVISLPSG